MLPALTVTFEVVGQPRPQGSKRALPTSAGIRLVESSAGLRDWREAVAYQARLATPADWVRVGGMTARLQFLTPYPASAYSKRDGSVTPAHAARQKVTAPDLDKLVRAVFDALTQAGVWADDAQCVYLVASKCYATYGGLRAEVTHAP